MLKSLTLLFALCLFSLSTSAQFKLSVKGDAEVAGRLELGLEEDANIFIGTGVGSANTTGISNTFLGYIAGSQNQNGNRNAFIGAFAGSDNISGARNVFVGNGSGAPNVSGNNNTYVGASTGTGNSDGSGNTLLGAGANTAFNSLNNATAIGNSARVERSNSLILGNDANVGIGTSAPDSKLEVVGERIRLIDPDNDQKYLDFRTDGGALDIASKSGQLWLSSYDGEGVIMEAFNGNVGIGNDSSPDFKLEVVGTAGKPGGGMWSDASDKRLKTDVEDFEDGLEQIRQIRPVWYRFKGDFEMPTKERYVGVIAQEMQKVAPYTITPYRDTDKKSGKSGEFLSYNGTAVMYMLVNAAQELAEEADEEKQKVRKLQTVVQEQQQQIDELKAMVNQLLAQTSDQISVQELELMRTAELSQNRPNPFRENTIINYFLPAGSGNAHLEVYDTNGKLLAAFPLTKTGKGQVQLNAERFPAGTYFYSLIVDGALKATRKMVLTE